jgi:hypothetical protein
MLIKKILIAFIFITSSGFSQVEDTTYSLTTEIGLGYSRYFTTMDYSDLNKSGFSGTLRIMWNPEHLLSIGLETGYQYLYSIDVKNIQTEFGPSDFSASMVSVPIFIAIAMKLTPNIKLIGGSGTYLLFNNGNPLSNRISIGGELQYSYYSKIQDQTSALQFYFVYKFLEW